MYSDMITLASGLFFVGASIALFFLYVTLGDDIKRLPCAPVIFRIILFIHLFFMANRGVSLLSTINTSQARHVHWDVLAGACSTFLFYIAVVIMILNAKMSPIAWRRVIRRIEAGIAANKNAKGKNNKELASLVAVEALDEAPPYKDFHRMD